MGSWVGGPCKGLSDSCRHATLKGRVAGRCLPLAPAPARPQLQGSRLAFPRLHRIPALPHHHHARPPPRRAFREMRARTCMARVVYGCIGYLPVH